jgi:hypothetical protein
MAGTVDELTANYEENGVLVVKEIAKEVLTKGAWATLMFLHQDLDRKSGNYGPPKITIRRYQRRDGVYMSRSKFTISSQNQALQIAAKIAEWFPQSG